LDLEIELKSSLVRTGGREGKEERESEQEEES
jgi:hypothetical protein